MNKVITGLMVVLVLICLVGISSAEIPDLVGNWNGSSIGYMENAGLTEYAEGSFSMNITEQTDRLFTGYLLTKNSDGADIQKNISGVISADGTGLYLAEHGEGLSIGTILGPDEFELTYLDSGDEVYAGIDHMVRIK